MQTARSTLNDVARLAGVSKATASRVLSGSRDRVSPELAARVMEAADELAYIPNPHAQALATAASPMVAVIVHDVGDPYFSEIARGALRVAAEQDRLVVICNTFRDPSRELAYVSEMRAQRIHAILVAGSSTLGLEMGGGLTDQLRAFREEGGRVAMMLAGHGHPAVIPDNRGGGRLAALHLLELDHTEMGVIAGPAHLRSVIDRLAGFSGALEEAGAPPPAVVNTDFTREGGASAAGELLAARPDVTAILALNDLTAVGVIRHLVARGRDVPTDVSVVGFDDIPLAGDIDPGLTTIRVPMEEMGASAMRMVLGEEMDDEPQIFPTELVIRESTAPSGERFASGRNPIP